MPLPQPAPVRPCSAGTRAGAAGSRPGRARIRGRPLRSRAAEPRPADTREPGVRARRSDRRTAPAPAVPRPPGSAGCSHRCGARFAAAGVVGTLAALFAVALAGLSGWLIIRASEQPPILYLLTAIVGVRFFGIGRAGPALPRTPPAARRRLRRPDPAPRQALGIAEPPRPVAAPAAAGRQRPRHRGGRRRHGPGPAAARGPAAADRRRRRGGRRRRHRPAAAGRASRRRRGRRCVSLVAAPALALAADRMSAGTEQRLRSGVLRQVAAALDARAELHANGVGRARCSPPSRAPTAPQPPPPSARRGPKGSARR